MPSVTGKVYNHSKRMKEKRAVLDGVAAELRRIIGSRYQRHRLKPNCGLLPDFQIAACRTEARCANLDRAFSFETP